ncbi:hypothetical protein Aph01nite_26510 [Acrocarpospora phusangensis]|uniref:AAA+ ATPase domain-containing protein n=1 Tax=Acrocarpospora phusangensis TaxID=1070424 RepID=A0A919Q8V6_9ACTN|nr:hypothetical protein Aph01nite_26510 [Acrocarpospora phusangensis]
MLGGVLLGAAVVPGVREVALSLFDAKAEAMRLGHELIGSLREKVTGVSRQTRTERLHAAHAIIITTAFFEAFDDLELPFSLSDLRLTYADKRIIVPEGADKRTIVPANITLHFWLESSDALPMSEDASGVLFRRQRMTYSRASLSLLGFMEDLAVWDELNAAQQATAKSEITKLPHFAAHRYQEMFRRLATDFPEFSFWADQREHHETQEQIRHGLGGLNAMLTAVASGRIPPPKLRSILALNQAAPARPISPTDDRPGGLTLPTLADGYVNPRFRLIDKPSDLSLEQSWADQPVRDDLQRLLAGFVTSVSAVRAPLLILGQPGVGKSVLTQMLAARLPAADFLPVRVPLRQVPADAGIQEQIEAAVRVTTGEALSWPDLARSADGALPVVLLDGLDELLQATGVNRADYLIQAQEFQRREAELGRPVAVIVTTRTAVADRCRLPAESVAIRLEPFSDAQVKSWIDTWNRTNAGLFASAGHRPLSPDDVLAHPELAEQPLLLLMLALYDADAETGRRLPDSTDLSLGDLYERLLRRFADREIEKHEPGISPERRAAAVEGELLRLSVAAFAMFNRGQQWVTQAELDRDLSALIPEPPAAGVGFQRPLTAAQNVIGRFFFIHQARALRESEELSTYEFLHATFGEYLIARLVRDLVRQAAEREALTRAGALGGMLGAPPEPGPFGALLSFAVLSVRTSIPQFLGDMGVSTDQVRPFLLRRFQEVYFGAEATRSAYEPLPLPAVQRIARQTANLVLLVTVLTGPVTAAELFGDGSASVGHWQPLVDLWRSGTHHDEWPSLVATLGIVRSWADGDRTLTVYWKGSHQVLPVSIQRDQGSVGNRQIIWEAEDTLLWAHNRPPDTGGHGWQVGPAHTSLDTGAGRAVIYEVFTPLYTYLREAVTSFADTGDGHSISLFTALNDLWLPGLRSSYFNRPALVTAYSRAFEMIARFSGSSTAFYLHEVLSRLAVDLPNLSPAEARELLSDMKGRFQLGESESHLIARCALDLVARDRVQLEFLGDVLYQLDLPAWAYLEAAVTLMELEIDPSEVPATAFDVVRRLRPDQMDEIERDHPHLFHRARRIIRADGGRFRLVWPG